MIPLIAATTLVLMLNQTALAQEAPEVDGAVGLATGAVGEAFFLRRPEAYHILASEIPGQPVFLDRTSTGIQQPTVDEAQTGGAAERGIREGTRPVGVITDVVIDRAGQVAGLVIELDREMRGGSREIAVAIGLVRMLPGSTNANETSFLLALDPVDLVNAPDFERPALPAQAGGGAGRGGAVQPQERAQQPPRE